MPGNELTGGSHAETAEENEDVLTSRQQETDRAQQNIEHTDEKDAGYDADIMELRAEPEDEEPAIEKNARDDIDAMELRAEPEDDEPAIEKDAGDDIDDMELRAEPEDDGAAVASGNNGSAEVKRTDEADEAAETEKPAEAGEAKVLENHEVTMDERVRNITKPYYEAAGELARHNETARLFTDHKEAHVEMVVEKSLEAADAVEEAVKFGNLGHSEGEDRVQFSADIDRKTLQGAAQSHDTGMSGDGYALEFEKNKNGQKIYLKDEDGSYKVRPENNSDFGEVRNNHSFNSAINLLANRDQYIGAGYTDEQVDKMAVECMAHSKSNSGLRDLNSKADWSDCFDRMDAGVAAYNREHPEHPISFNRTAFEGNDDKLGALASESYALRIGDVSRDSCPDAEIQSGEHVHVDRSSVDNRGGSVEAEIKNAQVTIAETGEKLDINDKKSLQVHIGEQNITENHTFFGENGEFTHQITVNDGTSAPRCTWIAIKDHLDELATAKDGDSMVMIQFDSPCDNYAIKAYTELRADLEMQRDYNNIEIHYPWDEV